MHVHVHVAPLFAGRHATAAGAALLPLIYLLHNIIIMLLSCVAWLLLWKMLCVIVERTANSVVCVCIYVVCVFVFASVMGCCW